MVPKKLEELVIGDVVKAPTGISYRIQSIDELSMICVPDNGQGRARFYKTVISTFEMPKVAVADEPEGRQETTEAESQ